MPAPAQFFDHLVGHVLHLGEDEDAVPARVAEQRGQEGVLVVLVDEHHPLHDALDGRRLVGDGHVHGVMDQGAGQGHHLGFHGGREKQRLALGRQLGDDPLDVREEAHVEHAVGFVQDEYFDRVQAGMALLHEVEQPPRRGHQDVEPAVQGLDLGKLADAAENDGMGEAQVAAVGGGAGVDLRRQFAGRRQDEDARAAARRLAFVQGQILQDGQDEGRGLARAGLGAADQVAARRADGGWPGSGWGSGWCSPPRPPPA